jgi:hypothetical protein
MDYKRFNETFKDLETFRHTNPLIERTTEYEMNDSYGDGVQGESNIYHEIYTWDSEMYIRLTINTDSYGCNEFVNGIAFVKPIQKTVSSFEAVS